MADRLAGGASIEEVRAFWDREPCNARESLQPAGTRAYFDAIGAWKYAAEPYILDFAQFERWSGKKVLEVGCGIGTDSINFARAGADLTVIDLSPASLDICKRRFEVYGLAARFFLGNAEDLSRVVPVEPYDLIYSFGVIHHTPHPRRVVEEMQRYAGPHTEIRVMLYSRWSLRVLSMVAKYGRGAFWRTDSLLSRYAEAQEGCPIVHVYSSREVRKLFQGFRILEMYKRHLHARGLPAGISRRLESVLGWNILLVASLEKP